MRDRGGITSSSTRIPQLRSTTCAERGTSPEQRRHRNEQFQCPLCCLASCCLSPRVGTPVTRARRRLQGTYLLPSQRRFVLRLFPKFELRNPGSSYHREIGIAENLPHTQKWSTKHLMFSERGFRFLSLVTGERKLKFCRCEYSDEKKPERRVAPGDCQIGS